MWCVAFAFAVHLVYPDQHALCLWTDLTESALARQQTHSKRSGVHSGAVLQEVVRCACWLPNVM